MIDTSTRKRSIVKAISWETISNAICLGLAYLMFGNFGGCLLFTGVCFVLKLGLFYYHDRIWHQIPFGKRPVFIEQPETWHENDVGLLPVNGLRYDCGDFDYLDDPRDFH